MTLYTMTSALDGIYVRLDDPQVRSALDPSLDIWCDDAFMKNALGSVGWNLAFMFGCRNIELPSQFFESRSSELALYSEMLNRASRLGLATLTKKIGRIVRAEVYFDRIIENPSRYQTHERSETYQAYDEILTANGFPDEPLNLRPNPAIKSLRDIHRVQFGNIGS